jgi:gluconate 2-dehydrogenase gamma chain
MNDILSEWDKNTGQARLEQLRINLKRRQFLHNSIKASSGLALLPSIALFSGCEQDPRLIQADIVREEPWKTFEAVQLILFPDDGNGPGAIDLNATAYLKFVLDAPDTDKEDQEFILKGVHWINELAKTHSKKKFTDNNQPQQIELIKKISKSSSGEHWLSYLLVYIFEALLSDPIYGGNPHAIGWKWLEHQAGFPRPPHDKTYIELLKK